jgi:Domain of unknown function (DUF3846)
MTKALLIPVEGPVEEVTLDGTLEQLQGFVGGYIEAVGLPGFITDSDNATAYVNEEGKLEGLAANMRATDFMVPGVGLMWGDYISGNMLVCGLDEFGEHIDIPKAVARRVRLIESEAA